MLALSTTGRTFSYPINKDANAFGQLGLRKISVLSGSSTRSTLELYAKAEIDPFAHTNTSIRAKRSVDTDGEQAVLESLSLNAPVFCDRLFEVPSLKGVEVAQAIAGARSSFVITKGEGRVLAWGANEYG